MISGKPEPYPRRLAVLLAAGWLALPGRPAAAAEQTVGEFLQSLARPAPDRIAFAEVRFSPLLERPLEVSGELEYLGPERLSRHVTEPYKEVTLIEGDRVRIRREKERERSFSLERAPELRGLLASFVAMLAGDAAALERYFEPTLTRRDADDPRWTLLLEPRTAAIRAQLGTLRIHGAGTTPRCISMVAGEGKASIVLLGPTAAARPEPLSPEALEQLCADTL